MNALKLSGVFFIFLALVLSVSAIGCFASDGDEVARSAVEGAERMVDEAFEAVLEAEKTGADVSGLLGRLDVAVDYLALASVCWRVGDFDGAVDNADFCAGALDGIVDDAEVLRDRAIREGGERSWMTIGGSIGGVVAVVCGFWSGWNFFKRRYYRRVLKMKPEVVEGES